MNKKQFECEQIINHIGSELSNYLSTHCKSRRKIGPEESISELQSFFRRYGLYVGTNRIEEQSITPEQNECGYYIAQYILEQKENHSKEYDSIINLVKGYYLQSAIYLQAQNGNLANESYSKVTFYYDTPFLLRLLNYISDDDYNAAIELHRMIKKEKGNVCYFTNTTNEIIGILTAYQHSLGNPHRKESLNALDERGYTYLDVERLKQMWQSNLRVNHDIQEVALPSYPTDDKGNIITENVLDESEIKEYLTAKIPHWKNETSLENDIQSIVAIHKIRGKTAGTTIEKAKAVFVTTNYDLVRVFNKYYKEELNDPSFPPLITDVDLSALTWIKLGSETDLPEKQLLKNAYMAMQPPANLLDEFSDILYKLNKEGNLTEEEVSVLRSDPFTKRELLFNSFSENSVNEDFVTTAVDNLKHRYTESALESERRKREEENHFRLEEIDRKARHEALRIAQKITYFLRILTFLILAIILVLAVWAFITTLDKSTAIILSIALGFVTILSAVDIIRNTGRLIGKGILWIQNRIQNRVYLNKLDEYSSFKY